MNDVEVLKKLLLLQGMKSPESEEFIAKWINDIKIAIAKDSEENIGFGSAIRVMQKYFKKNDKKQNGLDGMLETSKKGVYIFTDGSFGVKCKSNLKMPVISDQKSVADKVLSAIDKAAKENTKKVSLPTRAELDAVIKVFKATTNRTTSYPVYDFGEGLPSVNAELLFDLLTFFPMQNKALLNKDSGTSSSIYINFTPFEAVLLPVIKRG